MMISGTQQSVLGFVPLYFLLGIQALMTSNRIQSLDELDALYAKPMEASLAKELPELNEHYRKLIAASPFFSIASVGPGGLDCSPRGDDPGFVHVLDDKTLVIPDRRGNNRLDTLKNIVSDPRVGLLFLIPGLLETLRINGQAFISQDPTLIKQFEVDGSLPLSLIVVEIDAVYFQCARSLKRSKLWDSSSHVDPANLPSAGTLLRSAISGFYAEKYDAELPERQAKTLY